MTDPPTQTDRLLSGTRNLVDNETQSLAGVWEYTIVELTPLGISGTCTASGMPPITNAPGGPTNPLAVLPGTKVYVVFVNNDQSRPMVLSATVTSEILLASTAVGGSVPGPVTISTPMVVPIGTGTP